jgi:hypothetical protein
VASRQRKHLLDYGERDDFPPHVIVPNPAGQPLRAEWLNAMGAWPLEELSPAAEYKPGGLIMWVGMGEDDIESLPKNEAGPMTIERRAQSIGMPGRCLSSDMVTPPLASASVSARVPQSVLDWPMSTEPGAESMGLSLPLSPTRAGDIPGGHCDATPPRHHPGRAGHGRRSAPRLRAMLLAKSAQINGGSDYRDVTGTL